MQGSLNFAIEIRRTIRDPRGSDDRSTFEKYIFVSILQTWEVGLLYADDLPGAAGLLFRPIELTIERNSTVK
jgi:hypothetical protein